MDLSQVVSNCVGRQRIGNSLVYRYAVWGLDWEYLVQVEVRHLCCGIMIVFDDQRRVVYAECFLFDGSSNHYSKRFHEAFMSFLKKVDKSQPNQALLAGKVDEEFKKKFPALWEFLTVARYEDGQARETSTISISVADDGYKVCLRDRDNGRCLWVTGMTFFDTLKTLEATLKSEDAPWVRDRFAASKTAINSNGRQKKN